MVKQTLWLLLISGASLAQQVPQSSVNYELNPYYNPALSVNRHKLNATSEHRRQWVGFPGAPVTTWGAASYEIEEINSTFGLVFLHDELGASVVNDFRISYAYRWTVEDNHQIIPGVSLGLFHLTLNGSSLDPIQPGDPNIIGSRQTAAGFTMGLGIQYRFRHLVFGFAVNHLTGPRLLLTDQFATTRFTLARHFHMVGRYDFHFGRLIRLMPKFLFESDRSTHQFEGGLWLGFDNLTSVFERVNAGLAYRTEDMFVVSCDLRFAWFTLGYAYDLVIPRGRAIPNESHQVYLRVHLFKRSDLANTFDGL